MTTELSMKSDGKQLKVSEEVKLIDGWSYCYDELEELKKIFFEFLKRWVENGENKMIIN